MNKNLRKQIGQDAFRICGNGGHHFRALHSPQFLLLKNLRKVQFYQRKNHFLFLIFYLKFFRLRFKTKNDISTHITIGRGLCLIHEGPRYIFSGVRIGDNVTIHQGVTLGLAYGKKKGVPTIGNNVWLGPFCIVVGNVHIGDGAMICGGAFVNFDVPEKAIVIGNPGVIPHSKNGSAEYIGNPINPNA